MASALEGPQVGRAVLSASGAIASGLSNLALTFFIFAFMLGGMWEMERRANLLEVMTPDAYTRLDPGQSTIRLDFPAVTLGASTANQQWGPGSTHPLLLGNNAPGFTHLFLGTGDFHQHAWKELRTVDQQLEAIAFAPGKNRTAHVSAP